MVTFYLKMLLFIFKGGEADVNFLRKEWNYYLLECTLYDSFFLSFVSGISAVFTVKLNPVRLKSTRENEGLMRTICIYVFTVFAFSFHLLLTLGYFPFPFPVNITHKEAGNWMRKGL